MTPTKSSEATSSGWFTGRTRLVTIASIVAVSVAGATAVSANIGILDSASDSTVGDLSASGDLTSPSTQVVDVYLPETTAAPTATPAPVGGASAVQEFAVDIAGTVAVESTDDGLRLDSVTPAAGWSWTLTQTSQAELMVTMSNSVRALEFVATATVDGNIAANVSEPVVTPAPPAAGGGYDDDHGEDDDGDDGHDDDREEYEGGEDDD